MSAAGEQLQVEVRQGSFFAERAHLVGNTAVLITPPIGEDYWLLRVRLSETQAILAFPKFLTIGIGFAREADWNTNLPYSCDAREIFDHIAHNKGDASIPDERCVEAIRLIQARIAELDA